MVIDYPLIERQIDVIETARQLKAGNIIAEMPPNFKDKAELDAQIKSLILASIKHYFPGQSVRTNNATYSISISEDIAEAYIAVTKFYNSGKKIEGIGNEIRNVAVAFKNTQKYVELRARNGKLCAHFPHDIALMQMRGYQAIHLVQAMPTFKQSLDNTLLFKEIATKILEGTFQIPKPEKAKNPLQAVFNEVIKKKDNLPDYINFGDTVRVIVRNGGLAANDFVAYPPNLPIPPGFSSIALGAVVKFDNEIVITDNGWRLTINESDWVNAPDEGAPIFRPDGLYYKADAPPNERCILFENNTAVKIGSVKNLNPNMDYEIRYYYTPTIVIHQGKTLNIPYEEG